MNGYFWLGSLHRILFADSCIGEPEHDFFTTNSYNFSADKALQKSDRYYCKKLKFFLDPVFRGMYFIPVRFHLRAYLSSMMYCF